MTEVKKSDVISNLTADIVIAYVANNSVRTTEIPTMIADIYQALFDTTVVSEAPTETLPLTPAINPKKSVTPDAIFCLECGKAFKSLKRHLGSYHNLTPEDYRSKWSLSADYPIVAPAYASKRSELALQSGLGRKAG